MVEFAYRSKVVVASASSTSISFMGEEYLRLCHQDEDGVLEPEGLHQAAQRRLSLLKDSLQAPGGRKTFINPPKNAEK